MPHIILGTEATRVKRAGNVLKARMQLTTEKLLDDNQINS